MRGGGGGPETARFAFSADLRGRLLRRCRVGHYFAALPLGASLASLAPFVSFGASLASLPSFGASPPSIAGGSSSLPPQSSAPRNATRSARSASVSFVSLSIVLLFLFAMPPLDISLTASS